MSIKTDSTPVEAPKDPNATPVHSLLKLFASAEEMAEIDKTFREGGKGYGHYKQRLAELFFERFGAARAKRQELEKDPAKVDEVLAKGAERARERAAWCSIGLAAQLEYADAVLRQVADYAAV